MELVFWRKKLIKVRKTLTINVYYHLRCLQYFLEGLSASFCDGTASATPDELAKLQSAIQRAAERIAEKDYPDPEEVIKSSGAGNSTVDLDETEEKVEEGQGDGENNSFELTDEA